MKKIPALFARDGADLTREYNPDALWVVNGEGIATRKFDGTAVLVKNGELYARFDAKRGKTPPPDFVPCQDEPDPITGHFPGWVPATRPEDKWIREAYEYGLSVGEPYDNWTYEACGPRIGANQEEFNNHVLIKHGSIQIPVGVPTDYDGLCAFFEQYDIEGVVWWRDLNDVNCDKVKITGVALRVGKRRGKKR